MPVARSRTSAHTVAHRVRAKFLDFSPDSGGVPFAAEPAVIWFLEKRDGLLVCEIRRATGAQGYEFEIADAERPQPFTATHLEN